MQLVLEDVHRCVCSCRILLATLLVSDSEKEATKKGGGTRKKRFRSRRPFPSAFHRPTSDGHVAGDGVSGRCSAARAAVTDFSAKVSAATI